MNPYFRMTAATAALAVTFACGGKSSSTAPTPPVVNAHLTAPTPVSPGDNEQTSTLRPTLTVQNGTSDQPGGSRTYEFQISDKPDFSAAQAFSIVGFAATVSKTGVPEGTDGRTSFTPDADLQPTTKFYWRARVAQGSSTSDWSATRKFNSKLVGFSRAGQLYDPLIHGETIGERIGSTTFLTGKGIKINDATSYVKYALAQTVQTGEFSMEVEGLQANNPGNKTKVFGMQDGDGDFITNLYRVDVQYRGAQGVPPNCIQWRAMFGSDADRIEPDTPVRYASVYLLNPGRTYYWKASWTNTGFRLQVYDGGMNGSTMYDQAVDEDHPLTYNPPHHNAYLGAPSGRSGTESASIPGAIYRNVWIGSTPRPASLGSALQ